jgi:hypothetical protein
MLGIIAAYLITQGKLFFSNGLRPFVVSLVAILASFPFKLPALAQT